MTDKFNLFMKAQSRAALDFAKAEKEEALSTLCHCSSCEAHRKTLRKDLIDLSPDTSELTVELLINFRYSLMRKECKNVRED